MALQAAGGDAALDAARQVEEASKAQQQLRQMEAQLREAQRQVAQRTGRVAGWMQHVFFFGGPPYIALTCGHL